MSNEHEICVAPLMSKLDYSKKREIAQELFNVLSKYNLSQSQVNELLEIVRGSIENCPIIMERQ